MKKHLVNLTYLLGAVMILALVLTGCGGGGGGGAVVVPPADDGLGSGDPVAVVGADTTVYAGKDASSIAPGAVLGINVSGAGYAVDADGAVVTAGLDTADVASVVWAQANSVDVTITPSADGFTATVTTPDLTAYKDELFVVLETKRGIVTDEALGTRTGVLADRFAVLGYSHLDLEETEHVVVTATVTMTDGSIETFDTVITAHLPFRPATGLRNVPNGVPVLLHGKTQATYNWALTTPAGSASALVDATDQNPFFTPDITGTYVLTEADSATSLKIYSGTWQGAITGKDANGKPESGYCTICHNGALAPNKFTDWKESGHAEIFTTNINTSGYWGEGCFECHTVGFNTEAANDGVDDSSDYAAFLDSGLVGSADAAAWTDTLADFPTTASKANIQCENCHGPNRTPVHTDPIVAHNADADGDMVASRVSLSSDVCMTCHGEPSRHARGQQWQESGHSNRALALDEGTSTSCMGCHSANGYIEWSSPFEADGVTPKTPFDKDYSFATAPTEDEVEPISCVACHDPHAQGTISGDAFGSDGIDNNATVRLTGTTPELKAGFIATDVGQGAVCMPCHNSRRGAFNVSGNENAYGGQAQMYDRSTHGGPQSDILMGQNGLFITPGAGAHATYIEDTCVTCHMKAAQPPAELSNNFGGTNHTFGADGDICASCHLAITASTVQTGVHTKMATLEEAILDALEVDIMAIAAIAGVDGVLLNYSSSANTYDAIIDESGNVGTTTITSITMQTSYPHGYDFVVAGVADAIGTGHKKIAVWEDDNNDGIVDAAEVATGDGKGEAIVDPTVTLPVAGTVIATNGQNITKAKWNHDLVESDGSAGIHNPSYVNNLLDASITALTP